MTHNTEKNGIFLKRGDKVQIVYFSGTGGTLRAVNCFEKTFAEKGIGVIKTSLDIQETEHNKLSDVKEPVGMLLIVYPVYAFDAPIPLYEWLEGITDGKGQHCAVVSVSGGGEVWPNTACRVGCIEHLESKGYDVFYERMFIMPSNVLVSTNEQFTAMLLKVLPLKVENCVNEMISGAKRRTKKPLTANILIAVSRLEKTRSKVFGKNLMANGNCTGCGWCAEKCPRENITIVNGKPFFDNKCIICLRCVYGCPEKAIYSKHYSFFMIKGGFSLEQIEEHSSDMEILPLNKVRSGILYREIKNYVKDICR